MELYIAEWRMGPRAFEAEIRSCKRPVSALDNTRGVLRVFRRIGAAIELSSGESLTSAEDTPMVSVQRQADLSGPLVMEAGIAMGSD